MPSSRRRTRPRPRRGYSALDNLELGERPRERLNKMIPGLERCAWPRCRQPIRYQFPGDQGPTEDRYGLLCGIHATDVAIAVIQDQIGMKQVEEFFKKQTTERAVRFAKAQAEEERYEAEKAALRQDRDGFVYFLRVGERVKIGYSVDVKRRMRAYPPGSDLLAVEPGDRDLETQRHQQFAGSLTEGREWFRPTADIFELVAEIVTTYGEPKQFAHHYRRNQQPMRMRRAS